MAELSVDVGKHVCKVLEEAIPDVLSGAASLHSWNHESK